MYVGMYVYSHTHTHTAICLSTSWPLSPWCPASIFFLASTSRFAASSRAVAPFSSVASTSAPARRRAESALKESEVSKRDLEIALLNCKTCCDKETTHTRIPNLAVSRRRVQRRRFGCVAYIYLRLAVEQEAELESSGRNSEKSVPYPD